MSISTTSVRTVQSGVPSQKIAQPGAANKAQAGLLAAQSPALPTAASGAMADKVALELRQTKARQLEDGKLSVDQTAQSLQEINKVMDALSISVQFQMDPDFKEPIIKVVDQQTGEVIRQFPSEEVVRISKALDNLKGLLFAQTA